MPTSPQYMSTAQAGERLGISREHVRRLIQQGELRAEESINGFMVDTREVERFAAIRRVQRDQREFRLAIKDLAAKAHHVEGATAFGRVVASLRDELKVKSAFELSSTVAAQMEWMNQIVVADATLAALQEPVRVVTEQWRRMADDTELVLKQEEDLATFARRYPEEAQGPDWQPRREDVTITRMSLVSSAARNEEMPRGFMIPPSREERLEEKVDELSRNVEQLTELVMRQRDEADIEAPMWQQWAGSDRPEDVLAKLAAIRDEATGRKRAGENSTDVIREAREARSGDA
jgi:excisionase family DNA binding protein